MQNSDFSGFYELINEFEDIIRSVENETDVLEEGAKSYVNDLKKLPKPISKIRKSGYTHLIKTFSYRKKGKELEIGWGKYYGPMVENGTKKMYGSPHMKPLWEAKKDKYYDVMIKKMKLN